MTQEPDGAGLTDPLPSMSPLSARLLGVHPCLIKGDQAIPVAFSISRIGPVRAIFRQR
jgi:hypothetical protein